MDTSTIVKYIPPKFMHCANCKDNIFYGVDEMVLEFAKLFGNDPADLEFEDSELYAKKGYDGYIEWCDMIKRLHNQYFDDAFGTGEIATINYKTCPECGHINEYHSFYIDNEFILNQR